MNIRYIIIYLLAVFARVFPLFANYTHTIDSYSDFERYSHEVDGSRFTKFVIDVEKNTIYYFDVNTYEMHNNFVFEELLKKPMTPSLLREFNKTYAEEQKSKYLLGYLIEHVKHKIWTFALWEGDRAEASCLELAFNYLKKTFLVDTTLSFQPNSTYQETVARFLVGIPVITNDTLYRLSDYQLSNTGTAVGRLRIIPADCEALQFAKDEIIVMKELLPDMTPVAGIICEQFATPLSHLSLRARAWGVPNIGLQGASQKLAAYDGQYVFLSATRSGYTIRLATAAEIEQKQQETRQVLQLPEADLSEKSLKFLTSLSRKNAKAYGSKASTLGEIASKFQVPAGFAIPMYYYAEHLAQNGVQLTSEPASIQKQILEAPLNKAFLDNAWRHVQALQAPGVFVRSSTNAEDLPSFNGAGLYDTVANVTTKEKLEQAIKQVWASIWNHKAYAEREHFGIDHTSVFGAILVQVGIDASSAGVLITKDIFDPNETMEVYTINAKWGLGESVVTGSSIPEQILYNYDNGGIKVLTRANDAYITVFDERGGLQTIPNPHESKPILTDAQATNLAASAHRLKMHFQDVETLDIEWLFKDQTLYIVQVRPYSEKGQ